MAARSLGLAATLGLAANAFLLPPDLSSDSIFPDVELDSWTLVDPQSQPLLVPCKGCGLDGSDSKNLFLNLSVGLEPGTLELGGERFFPPSPMMQPSVLTVPTSKSMADAMAEPEEYTSVPVSGLVVLVHKAETVSEDGEELLELTLDIHSIDHHRVSVPSVQIDVLKDSEARLTILSSKWTDSDSLEAGVPEDKPECQGAICEWRQFIEDKIHGISAAAHKQFGSGRPCPGKMMGMMKDGEMPEGPFTNMHHGPGSHHHRPIGETGRPHHHDGHPKLHGHHHHMFLRRVGQFLMVVAVTIVVLLAAYALGAAIGTIVGLLLVQVWRMSRRNGRNGYAGVALSEEDAANKDLGVTSEARESFESAPPLYEDAPAYEEKQVV